MNSKEILKELEKLGNEKMRVHNAKYGAGENQFGVKMGDIRALAKKIKTNHELALELWETENIDARFLAVLLLDPKKISTQELTKLVESEKFTHVADWLYTNIIKVNADKEILRNEWMKSSHTMAVRAAWSLTSGCVARNAEVLDIPALLTKIEAEMPKAAPEIQWTMNSALANIGIHFPEYRERAIAIGEKLGVYRDYPTSKGCTSPFAPIWINEIVRRKG